MFFCGFLLSIKDNKLAANDVYFVNYSPRTRIWANHTSLQKLERILERSGEDSILHVLDTLLGKYLILKLSLLKQYLNVSKLGMSIFKWGKSWCIRKVFVKHILNTASLCCGRVIKNTPNMINLIYLRPSSRMTSSDIFLNFLKMR